MATICRHVVKESFLRSRTAYSLHLLSTPRRLLSRKGSLRMSNGGWNLNDTVVKPVGFALAVGCAGLGAAAYVDSRLFPWFDIGYERRQLERARRSTANHLLRKPLDEIQKLRCMWDELSDGKQLFICLTTVNAIVFSLWHIPSTRLHNFMRRYFLHEPASGGRLQMLGSTLSHVSVPHILVNSYVLYTFSEPITRQLGTPQLLGFSLCAGLSASVASLLHSYIIKCQIGGLGISGVIMGWMSFFALSNPDAQFSLIFLPMVPISAVTALGGLVAFDVAGLILGWRTLGHAAHLGGVVFGGVYQQYGQDIYHRICQIIYIL
eukprot:m.41713 g.41713  ORF g.41713 m.41713 type:complete len:321 (-) comp9802_c0_seq2:227-1189(-)